MIELLPLNLINKIISLLKSDMVKRLELCIRPYRVNICYVVMFYANDCTKQEY